MALKKNKKQTHHGLQRMAERMGVTQKSVATKTIQNANRLGKCIQQFPDGEFKNYLLSKQHNKRVKVYKGFVFIFNKTSDRVITLYPIPEEFKEEYNTYGKQ